MEPTVQSSTVPWPVLKLLSSIEAAGAQHLAGEMQCSLAMSVC